VRCATALTLQRVLSLDSLSSATLTADFNPVTRSKRREPHAVSQHTGGDPSAVRVAVLLAGSTPEVLIVQISGDTSGPQRARTTVPFDPGNLERTIIARQSVVVVFENGDPTLPIVTGVLQPPPPATPLQELMAKGSSANANANKPSDSQRVEARLDGKRVVLEGRDEVVLKCGDASITLRRDGKIILRGAYVETNAKGVNRIKGGSVKIN
jgi:Domain of unknown function (DUF6484)